MATIDLNLKKCNNINCKYTFCKPHSILPRQIGEEQDAKCLASLIRYSEGPSQKNVAVHFEKVNSPTVFLLSPQNLRGKTLF